MLNLIRTVFLTSALLITAASLMAQEEADTLPGLNESTFKGIEWRGIGPALMSGRISHIALHPDNPSVWYVAVGSGGVWKTTNRGISWTPLFDSEGSYSIGTITVDPNNPATLWVGTGENVSGRHVGYGDGVYKSMDGGVSWTNMGLNDSQHIGMIVVDPRDSDTVFVASQGPLWSGGGDRGLYKTTDGGQNWDNVLSGNPFTGVTEVHIDPRNPDVMYAATYQRLRTVAALMNGGPESGIHKSTDGGRNWRKLSAGLPSENMGKIGMAVSPVNPDIIYATIELAQRKVEFYRSADRGETWEKRSEYQSQSTGPHYYIELFASPHNADHVYEMDSNMRFSTDGGKTLAEQRHDTKHVDHHALAFDPDNPDYLVVGNDGGIYETWDSGQSWRFVDNLPVTQFYKVAVDYDTPFYNIYGGTQDNSTQGGPSRTDNVHGIRNQDWFITVFADGHQPAVDPTNPDIIYSEWQNGNLVRYDRKNGQIVYIQPQPEAGEPTERFNWDAPILISPHDPARLYYASHRLWRSDNRGDSWTAISGDLTRPQDRLTQPMMGQVWAWESHWDLSAMSNFNTITSVSESPLVDGLLYVGTDDGQVQVSEDGGANWRAINKLPGVPENFFVNDIKADLHDADAAYVVVDNHKSGDFSPYVLKTFDRGRSWLRIDGDLPERHVAWRLVQDHVNPSLLFIGTEFGVFFSVEGGRKWVKLSGGVPNIPFRDLAIQQRENDLVGATFGRGFYILDDYSALRSVSAEQLEQEATLFGVRDAHWYVARQPLGSWEPGNKGAMGDSYFVAPNPPFGAVFTYYLNEGYKSAGEARREADRKANKAGEDAPYPGFDVLNAEETEDKPAIILTVRNAQGELVRRVEGPVKPGFHRVAWDLRYPESSPWKPEAEGRVWMEFPGPLVNPGTFSVSLSKRIDGVETELAPATSFEVIPMHEAALAGSSPEELTAFVRELDEILRHTGAAASSIAEILVETRAAVQAMQRSAAPNELREQARAIELKAVALQMALSGDPQPRKINTSGPVSILNRLQVAQMGTAFSTYGPTPTHLRSVEIAKTEFAQVKAGLKELMETQLPALRKQLDEAGVPWSPGRGVASEN
jgi:photosystem II stability/assembly factor-like uncharacterized protein